MMSLPAEVDRDSTHSCGKVTGLQPGEQEESLEGSALGREREESSPGRLLKDAG